MQDQHSQRTLPVYCPRFNTLATFLVSLVLLDPAQAGLFQKRTPAPQPSPPPIQQIVAIPAQDPYAQALPETVVYHQPVYTPPSYSLPHEGYHYPRSEGRAKSSFFGASKPSEAMLQLLSVIRERAEHIAKFNLVYKFGGDHPSEGGMDCSGTMQFMLSDLGFKDMPRTSYDQYRWLRKNRTLIHSKSIPDHMGGRKGIKPGDLIFWGGTYNSGHKVSHVMIYLGQNEDGTHYMFGARSKSKRGLNGSGVDIFVLESGKQKGLIGYGTLPGVS